MKSVSEEVALEPSHIPQLTDNKMMILSTFFPPPLSTSTAVEGGPASPKVTPANNPPAPAMLCSFYAVLCPVPLLTPPAVPTQRGRCDYRRSVTPLPEADPVQRYRPWLVLARCSTGDW